MLLHRLLKKRNCSKCQPTGLTFELYSTSGQLLLQECRWAASITCPTQWIRNTHKPCSNNNQRKQQLKKWTIKQEILSVILKMLFLLSVMAEIISANNPSYLVSFFFFCTCNHFLPSVIIFSLCPFLSFLFQSFLTTNPHWGTTVVFIHGSTMLLPAIVPLFWKKCQAMKFTRPWKRR